MTRFRGFQKYAYKRQKPGYYLHDFLNTKNPLVLFANKKFVLGIISLALIIGGIVLAQGPLLHSNIPNPLYGYDPYTALWSATSPNSNLAEFNTFNVARGSGLTQCGGTTTVCLIMSPTTGNNAFALSKTTIGDLSPVSGKELLINNFFALEPSQSCCPNLTFGWYLTTNSSNPIPNATNYHYDPYNDKSVALLVKIFNPSASLLTQVTYINKNLGFDTISQEDAGCNSVSSSSSCFMTQSHSLNPIAGQSNLELNFTGNTGQRTCDTVSFSGGNGCSYEILGAGGSTFFQANSILPTSFNFQTIRYYIGFYQLYTATNSIIWTYDNSLPASACDISGCMNLGVYVPTAPVITAPAPTIDTGGFFGPVIRALISIAVFMVANIISFGNYLGGLMGPVWAFLGGLAATVLNGLSSIIITLINDLGSLIGDPNLGNQLVSVFTQIGSYITGLFTSIGNIVSNLITFIQNSMTFLFDATNGFLTYWIGTVLFGILGVLVTISNIIVTVLKVFQVAFPFVVLADLLWLLSESIDNGTEGAMKWWIPHEILVVNVGKLMFILVETLSTFVYQTIVEIEGGAADIKPEIAGFSP